MFYISKITPPLFAVAVFNLFFSLFLKQIPEEQVLFYVTLVFGFVGLVLLGAMYQIIPNSQNRKLSHPQVSYWVLGGTVASLILFYFHRFELGSLLLFASVATFYLHGLRNISNWTPVTVKFIGSSATYLTLSTLFLFLSFNFDLVPFQLAIHTLTVGAMLNAVYGVELAWIPMLLMETLNVRKAQRLFWIKQATTLVFLASFLFMNYTAIAVSSLLEFGVSLFFLYLIYGVIANRRMPAPLPPVVRIFLVAMVFLPFGLAVGTLTAAKPAALPFTVDLHLNLLVYGFTAFTIFGGIFHLLPRIVWNWKFAGRTGGRVPAVSELVDEAFAPKFLEYAVPAFLIFLVLDNLNPPLRAFSSLVYAAVVILFVKVAFVPLIKKLKEVEDGGGEDPRG